MKVGIISRCIRENEKRSFLRKAKIYQLSDKACSVEIPYSLEEIKNFSEAKRERVMKKCEKKLNAAGAEQIIYTKDLKKESFDTVSVFYKFAPQAVRLAAKRFDVKLPLALGIRQKTPDYNALFVAKSLIYDSADIKILTDKPGKGGKIREKIMEEFGAVIEILPYDFVFSKGITVNLDKSEICIFGKWVLCDFEAEVESFGYNVDSLELFSVTNGNFEEIVIKNCRCGKNKLTLGEN